MRLPCIKSRQGGENVKRLDDIELGGCETKEKLTQTHCHLKDKSFDKMLMVNLERTEKVFTRARV